MAMNTVDLSELKNLEGMKVIKVKKVQLGSDESVIITFSNGTELEVGDNSEQYWMISEDQ